MAAASAEWTFEWLDGDPGGLHARPLAAGRTATVCRPDRAALVLGSAQPETDVAADRAAAGGVEVVRRRGGGGAVWLAPGDQLWLDVTVGAGDTLWDDDVGRAFLWLGEVWLDALARLGIDASMHRAGLVRSPWSSAVCFAGLGPGEVHVGGAKLVGISQRRVRDAARFQCVVYDRFAAGALVDLLAFDDAMRRVITAELAATTVGLGDVDGGVRLDDLEGEFLRRLP